MSEYDTRSHQSGAGRSFESRAEAPAQPGRRTLTEALPEEPMQVTLAGEEPPEGISGGAGGAGGPDGGAAADEAPVDAEAMMAGGRPLDGAVRAKLEQRFGRSLGEVRIHDEPAAAASVMRAGVPAYTYKNHIAFAPGRYQPETPEGMALLAHELTHFIQGGGEVGAPGGDVKASAADGGHEAEANRVAMRSMNDDHLAGGPAPGQALEAALPTREASSEAGQKLDQGPAAGWEVNERADGDRAHRCIAGCAPTPAPAPARPSLATIMANGTVAAGLNQAWTDSHPNAPAVARGTAGSTKQEQGGWIIWNPTANTYVVQRVPAGTRDALAPIVGTKPADTATAIVVAWFHTHPNTRAEGYSPEPGASDQAFTQSARVPGIVKTHEGDRTIPYP